MGCEGALKKHHGGNRPGNGSLDRNRRSWGMAVGTAGIPIGNRRVAAGDQLGIRDGKASGSRSVPDRDGDVGVWEPSLFPLGVWDQ